MKNKKEQYFLYNEDSLTYSQRKRLRALDGIFSDIKGERSETRIEEMLRFLVNVNFIESYKHSEKYSELDSVGIDFTLKMRGVDLPLQVKSSVSALKKHKMVYPDIPVVCATIPEKDLIKHLMTVLHKAYNRKVYS